MVAFWRSTIRRRTDIEGVADSPSNQQPTVSITIVAIHIDIESRIDHCLLLLAQALLHLHHVNDEVDDCFLRVALDHNLRWISIFDQKHCFNKISVPKVNLHTEWYSATSIVILLSHNAWNYNAASSVSLDDSGILSTWCNLCLGQHRLFS